jgi:hypothetical protein
LPPWVAVRSCFPAAGLFAALVLGIDEPDRPLGRIGRHHEFAQGVEDVFELSAGVAAEGVVAHGRCLGLVFELGQLLGQVRVQGAGLLQPDEGAHDIDAHLHRTRSGQRVGRLDGAVLGEGVGHRLGKLQLHHNL